MGGTAVSGGVRRLLLPGVPACPWPLAISYRRVLEQKFGFEIGGDVGWQMGYNTQSGRSRPFCGWRLDCAPGHGWAVIVQNSGSRGSSMDTIRNPIEWGMDQLKHAAQAAQSVGHSIAGDQADADSLLPAVRQVKTADLKDALTSGFSDFGAFRTDVVFICLFYPVLGFVLARFALQENLLPLLFPLACGFALIGPVAAVGLYEMSRRREQGQAASWAAAFGTIRSPSFGAILALGFVLLATFALWIVAAQGIYMATLGPEPPTSIPLFVRDVFTTGAGWAMIIVGMGVGFIFALVVLTISVVSFPLLLDRDVGILIAVWTSVRAVAANPGPMALWGLIVAGGLVVGSLPLFLGLIVVLPVLGHATWHLYRKVVPH